MEIIPEDVIWGEFWNKYLSQPKGWRFYSGISSNGCPELLITGKEESWMVRRESLYSGKLGIGGRIAGNINLNPTVETFGLREIPMRYIKKVMTMGDDMDPFEKAKIITKILKTPPTTIDKIRSTGAIQGPILHSCRALPLISKEQAKLDRELNMEIDKLKQRITYLQ